MIQPTTETHDDIVEGMTGSYRVLSVREEVSEVPGVRTVDIDLRSGRLTRAIDPRVAAMVAFGQQVIAASGQVTDEPVDELRDDTHEQIAEVPGS